MEMTKARLTVVWALVAVPLAYGILQTLTRVAALFTG